MHITRPLCFISIILPAILVLLYILLPHLTPQGELNMSIGKHTPTIAVVGGSYVGMRLAQALLPLLPPTHRVVVVEANSHFHHLFTFPRFSVLHRGGEEKALIPYTHALPSANATMIHAKALSIHALPNDPSRGYLKLDRGDVVEFDYLAIATGTKLREPWSLPSVQRDGVKAKREAVQTLRDYQDKVKEARRIVVVGGGAVGIQVACDIAELYPGEKSVTVLHSRERVMNKFHPQLHEVVAKRFAERGVKTVLGSRVVIPSSGFPSFQSGQTFNVELQNGTTVPADLVLMCTGQTPRSDLLASFASDAITSDGFIDVLPTMQINSPTPSALKERIFALGDIANSGAAKTVRAAMGQIDVIKSNILAMIAGEKKMQEFTPGPTGIHLSLGLYESIKFRNPEKEGGEPGNMGIERDLKLDMGIEKSWRNWNVPEGTPWHL